MSGNGKGASSKVKQGGRGTNDEIEAIKLVLESMPGLKRRVLERIRQLRAANSETAIDVAKKMHEKQKKDGPKK